MDGFCDEFGNFIGEPEQGSCSSESRPLKKTRGLCASRPPGRKREIVVQCSTRTEYCAHLQRVTANSGVPFPSHPCLFRANANAAQHPRDAAPSQYSSHVLPPLRREPFRDLRDNCVKCQCQPNNPLAGPHIKLLRMHAGGEDNSLCKATTLIMKPILNTITTKGSTFSPGDSSV